MISVTSATFQAPVHLILYLSPFYLRTYYFLDAWKATCFWLVQTNTNLSCYSMHYVTALSTDVLRKMLKMNKMKFKMLYNNCINKKNDDKVLCIGD